MTKDKAMKTLQELRDAIDIALNSIKILDIKEEGRAHWIKSDDPNLPFICSNCKEYMKEDTPFCPDCGAEMEEFFETRSKMDEVKSTIKTYYPYAEHGIFDCRNLVGDTMYTIYDKDGVQIDICYDYSYFEVFGLTNVEFGEIEEYYNSLGDE